MKNIIENTENKFVDLICQFVDTLDTDEKIKEILKKILSLDENSQAIIKHFVAENTMDNDDIKTCIDVVQDFMKE